VDPSFRVVVQRPDHDGGDRKDRRNPRCRLEFDAIAHDGAKNTSYKPGGSFAFL
jgi:hypothetical protein